MAVPLLKAAKAPSEILDYKYDLTAELAGRLPNGADDTISTATWTVPTGLTLTASSFTASTATVWLSGGTIGNLYEVSLDVVTVGGRTYHRSFKLPVDDR